MTRKPNRIPRRPKPPVTIRWDNPLLLQDDLLSPPAGHLPYTEGMLRDLWDVCPDHAVDECLMLIEEKRVPELGALLASLSKRYAPGDQEWALYRAIYYARKHR